MNGPAKHLADPSKWPFLVDFEVKIAVLTPQSPPKVDDGYGNWSWVVLGGLWGISGCFSTFLDYFVVLEWPCHTPGGPPK